MFKVTLARDNPFGETYSNFTLRDTLPSRSFRTSERLDEVFDNAFYNSFYYKPYYLIDLKENQKENELDLSVSRLGFSRDIEEKFLKETFVWGEHSELQETEQQPLELEGFLLLSESSTDDQRVSQLKFSSPSLLEISVESTFSRSQILDDSTKNLKNITEHPISEEYSFIKRIIESNASQLTLNPKALPEIIDCISQFLITQQDIIQFSRICFPLFFEYDDQHFMDTALISATRNREISRVRAIIARSFLCSYRSAKDYCNKVNINGQSALTLASYKGYGEIVQSLLLIPGIDIDYQIKQTSWNPLLYACRYQKSDIVKLLLSAKANPNVENNKGQTPLILGAFFGDADIVRYLLEDERTDIHKKDKVLEVPAFITALLKGYEEIAITLLNRQNLSNDKDLSIKALAIASQKGLYKCVESILDQTLSSEINLSQNYHTTALYHAIKGKYIEIILLLLERGADPRLRIGSFKNALFFAIYNLDGTKGIEKVIEAILKKFSPKDMNTPNDQGKVVLEYAFTKSRPEWALMFLKNQANPNQTESLRLNCLFLSIQFHLNEAFFYVFNFISKDVCIDSLIQNELTLLHKAILLKNSEIAVYLLQKGANPALQTSMCQNALFLAVVKDLECVVLEIIKRGSFLELDIYDTYGWTLLHYAVNNQNASMVKILLDAGASLLDRIDRQTLIGTETALHLAVVKDSMEIIELLLKAGASLNKQGISKNNILMKAI